MVGLQYRKRSARHPVTLLWPNNTVHCTSPRYVAFFHLCRHTDNLTRVVYSWNKAASAAVSLLHFPAARWPASFPFQLSLFLIVFTFSHGHNSTSFCFLCLRWYAICRMLSNYRLSPRPDSIPGCESHTHLHLTLWGPGWRADGAPSRDAKKRQGEWGGVPLSINQSINQSIYIAQRHNVSNAL